jgi:hypothetical protein
MGTCLIRHNVGHKKRGLATTFKMPTSLMAMFFYAVLCTGALLSTVFESKKGKNKLNFF